MLYVFLQAGQSSGGMQTILMFGLMFVVLYFFMIRPQQKKQKEEKNFQANLKKGDRVVTVSGIHGKVSDLTEDSVIIETLAGKIKFERTSISREFSALRYSNKNTSEEKVN